METGPALLFLLGAFAGSAAVTWALVPLVLRLAHALGWLDLPGGRHLHAAPVPRVGGIALMAGLLAGSSLYGVVFGWSSLAGILDRTELVAVFAPCALVFLIGLLDDLRGLGPSPRLLVEAIAAAMAIQAGYKIDLVATPWGPLELGILTFPVTLLWFVAVTNAFNLIDGLDGLLATVGLVSLLGCAAVGLHAGMVGTPALALAMAGALIGILPWNWAPARIFLGDSGALLVGFTAAAWSLKVSRNPGGGGTLAFHVPLLLCFLPLAELVLTVSRRWLSGVPLFVGDRSHIHHVLLNKGLGVRQAVASLGGVAVLFAGAAYLSRSWREEGLLATSLVLMAAAFLGLRYLGYVELRVLLDRLRETLLRQRRRHISGLVAVARAGEGLSGVQDLDGLANRLALALEGGGFRFVGLAWSEEARRNLAIGPREQGRNADSSAWLAGQAAGTTTWVFAAPPSDSAPRAAITWSLPLPPETGRYGTLVVQRPHDPETPPPSERDLHRYLTEPLTLALMSLETRAKRAAPVNLGQL